MSHTSIQIPYIFSQQNIYVSGRVLQGLQWMSIAQVALASENGNFTQVIVGRGFDALSKPRVKGGRDPVSPLKATTTMFLS